jgi:hypothetical protein
MKPEKISFVFLVGGVGMFALAFVTLVASPWWMLRDVPMAKIEDLARQPDEYFVQMKDKFPETFAKAFGEADAAGYAKALRLGRDTYIAEGCWHCHSQFIRPIPGERERFGKVSTPTEYQNELQLPQLFGTRRVGPDLTRVGGKYENGWHFKHFKNPPEVVPGSVMPSYPWLYDKNGDPNGRGLALVAYMQWLGTWPQIKGLEEDWQ